jgi:hypothetical protein
LEGRRSPEKESRGTHVWFTQINMGENSSKFDERKSLQKGSKNTSENKKTGNKRYGTRLGERFH